MVRVDEHLSAAEPIDFSGEELVDGRAVRVPNVLPRNPNRRNISSRQRNRQNRYRNRFPSWRHFMFQGNTVFCALFLHCSVLPISRALMKASPWIARAASSLWPSTSKVMVGHAYCVLHIAASSIVPVLGLRSLIFGNLSPHLNNALNPAMAANAANNADSDSDSESDSESANELSRKRVFEEYLDKWSLSNQLCSVSLMLSMVPFVSNVYAMLSVFCFGMSLGEAEDIMRWTHYRLKHHSDGEFERSDTLDRVRASYYAPWILGVVGITTAFTIEVWATAGNVRMAHRFKRVSLAALSLSVALSFGHRSYLETGYFLRYTKGRDVFERMSEVVVRAEIGVRELAQRICELWKRAGNRERQGQQRVEMIMMDA